MLMLPISKSDQQKQEVSNIKQIEVQNYPMFQVKLSQTLESFITYSDQDYDRLFFEHFIWSRVGQKSPNPLVDGSNPGIVYSSTFIWSRV